MMLSPEALAPERFPRFKPYAEYRETRAAWLGAAPAGWNERRLRASVSTCQNGIWGDEPDGINDVICMRVSDFDRGALRVHMSNPTIRSIPPGDHPKRLLAHGDLLLEKSGGGERQPVGAVVLYDWDVPAVCSNFIARMTVAPGYQPGFLAYLHATLYSARVNTKSIKQSTGIQNLDSDSYLDEVVCFPSLNEQRAIADFLDRETAKIDTLVARKQRLIELLQEKRAALITRAVTRGLDPDVPLRDSGVPWLGSVPAHWRVRRLKFAARLESGHTPNREVSEYWENCTIPWISLNDVSYLAAHDYAYETVNYINELGLAHSSARMLPPGTVVLSRDATIGRCAILGKSMATSQHFVNWVCRPEMLPEYLLLVFRGPMQQEFERLTMGATLRTIGMPDVKSFVAPVPPVAEQRAIVDSAHEGASAIDRLTERVREGIERLREYRAALITAAVTGKIDVRGEVV